MCFSFKISLVSAAYLLSLAYAGYRKFQHRRLLLLFPFMFGVQQLAEAGVWATFDYGLSLTLRYFFSYIFLLFAFIVWPAFVPYCFYRIEPVADRQKKLKYLCYFGLAISLYLAIRLLLNPLDISITCSSVRYYIESQPFMSDIYMIIAYMLAIVLPCLISSIKWADVFGMSIFVAWLISAYAYEYAFTSVWCFFAALISGGIYFLF